jgi:transposase
VGFNFLGSDADQLFLLPPDARDWLPAGHLAWQVRRAVGEMDLGGFYAGYRRDGQGAAAYHPAALLGLVLYCYCKGIRSSRAIEAACFDDLGARVITGNRQPDHATVARFIHRHETQIKPLFVQGLVLCARDGLLSVDLVAGDGTKVKANASMTRTLTAEQLGLDIAELEAVLAAEVEAWLAQTAREDAQDALVEATTHDPGGDGPGGDAAGGDAAGVPGRLRRAAATLARRTQAKQRLADEQQRRDRNAEQTHHTRLQRASRRRARAEARLATARGRQQARVDDYQRRAAAKAGTGKAPDGRAPVPVQAHRDVRAAVTALTKATTHLAAVTATPVTANGKPPRINTTDPTSRIMPGKHDAYLQAHNLQLLANRDQVILAVTVHDNPADVAALHPLLRQARANLDAAGRTDPITTALFDAGYACTDNFTTDSEPTLYIAVTNPTTTTDRTLNPTWQAMADRLATPDGKTRYRQRAAIIEPVFAQLFQRLGRTLHYRGPTVTTELHLWALTHNLLKLFRHRPATT